MNESKWLQLRGDGGTQACSDEQLCKIKEEFELIVSDSGESANDRRRLAEDIRFCRWAGQSMDGKKHKDAQNGKPAFPFEGASDKRERTADQITNEQVIIIMAAVMRLNPVFTGINNGPTTEANSKFADSLGVLWQFALRNQIGPEWFVEWTKFAQWRQGDSPGLAFMQVCWHQETALRPITVGAQEIVDRATSLAAQHGVQITPEDAMALQELLVNPDSLDALAMLLAQIWPEIKPATATKAAKALQADQVATFPVPYICENRLKFKARRLNEDIFVPSNSPHDINRNRLIYVREWFSETELREREAKGDFKPGFVDEVLKHEGESGWQTMAHYDAQGEFSESPITMPWNKERQRGLYEILTVFYRAVNTDGIPGIYSVDYHHEVDFAGTDQELLDYNFGKCRYPFIASAREIISALLWDSRGNSELSATEQGGLKLLHDSFMDHAQLTTVPPLEVPASRPKMAIVWGPLKQIKVNRSGEIKPMPPMAYPASNDKMQKTIQDGLARYFGQFAESNPPDYVRLYQQNLVDFMLIPVAEAIWMGLKLCLQYMPIDELQRVIGPAALPADAMERVVDADFQAEVSFEAGMLSMDYMKLVGEMITNFLLPWDTSQTVPRADLVKWFFSNISPTMANRLIRPVDEADQNEIEDEEKNFTKITSGIEPPMVEDGQNYQLRRATLLGIGQKNPQAFQALTPNSQLILEARLKHLDGMIEQQKNAVIGRTMAAPALNGTPPATEEGTEPAAETAAEPASEPAAAGY